MNAFEVWLLLFRPLAFPPKLGGAHGAAVLFMDMEQSLVSQPAPELGYEHTGEP